MKNKITRAIKWILIFITIMVLSVITFLIGGRFFFSHAPLWRSIQSPPKGHIVSILDVGMIPMGHIDNVYVLTDEGEVYIWEREPSMFYIKQGKWRMLSSIPQNESVIDLKKFSAFPHYGVYVKTNENNYYSYTGYDSGSELWELISQEEYNKLPRKDYHDEKKLDDPFWPKVVGPPGKIIDRDSFYVSGSMSEEARNYVLMQNGSLKVLSRTFSPFSGIEYMIIGFIIGIVANIALIIATIIRKKRLLKK